MPSYVEPKNPETRNLVKVCGLLLDRAHYNSGMHYSAVARDVPDEIIEFYQPHGQDITEEQLHAAVSKHVAQHAWRLNPVYIENIYRNFNKPYAGQEAALKQKVAELQRRGV